VGSIELWRRSAIEKQSRGRVGQEVLKKSLEDYRRNEVSRWGMKLQKQISPKVIGGENHSVVSKKGKGIDLVERREAGGAVSKQGGGGESIHSNSEQLKFFFGTRSKSNLCGGGSFLNN